MTNAARNQCERAASATLEFVERERDFMEPAHAACDGEFGSDEDLPEVLWRRALHDPVRHALARPGKGFRGRLVLTAYRAAGGDCAPPALPHIVELLHAGSLVIDDLEDGSPERRGAPALHRVYGAPLAINTGNWLYYWPAGLLTRLGLSLAQELELHRQLVETMCRAHRGQALDLTLRVGELAQSDVTRSARAIAALKTGALMEFAARLGATCAGADEERVQALARFGRSLGIGLQRLDDWGGIASARMRPKGHEDLRLERVTWPWAVLAETLDPAGYARLVQQLARDKQTSALELLRASLRMQVLEREGHERPKRELAHALARLRAELAPRPGALAELEDEIARLEVSYG